MNRSLFLPLRHELIVDNFAGGGGASTGIEAAFGRPVDIAINHDPEAIAMHRMNHPQTQHYCEDVFSVDPLEVTGGQPVGLAWFSPDCKHHSKAKGGKPVEKRIRGLAWVVIKWARTVRPRVIMLENVEEFADWGPLIEGADGKTYPDKARKGLTFRRWVGQLKAAGYHVEHQQLRASDYGAPTRRKRLFVIARCDGRPIVWPKATHGKGKKAVRTAAECIDWSLPCPSIFERKRSLAPATLRRIATGIQRYVIDADKPFIVPITHTGGDRVHSIDEPLRTVTTARRGELALCSPTLAQTGYGEREGQSPRALDLHTPLVSAFLAQHNGGTHGHQSYGHDVRKPVSTITGRATQQNLVTSHLLKLKGTSRDGQPVGEPLHTIMSGGTHFAEVRAFLINYYSEGSGKTGASLRKPLPTIPTRDRIGLVTIEGSDYAIVDIGMRMLQPHELFAAQGFPDDYIRDRGMFINAGGRHEPRPLTKTAQVRMCGNSVCPPLSEALVRANFSHEQRYEAVA